MTRDEFRNSDSISVVLGRVALRGGNVKRTEKNREELDNAIDAATDPTPMSRELVLKFGEAVRDDELGTVVFLVPLDSPLFARLVWNVDPYRKSKYASVAVKKSGDEVYLPCPTLGALRMLAAGLGIELKEGEGR